MMRHPPPGCMRIVAWRGLEPLRCGGRQQWQTFPTAARCTLCKAGSRLRADHVKAALEGLPYNHGWRDFRPQLGRWRHEEEYGEET